MTKLIALIGLTLATVSQAATLAPGETANINGTNVTCAAGGADQCKLDTNYCATAGYMQIRVNGQAITGCEALANALVDLKALRQAGACN